MTVDYFYSKYPLSSIHIISISYWLNYPGSISWRNWSLLSLRSLQSSPSHEKAEVKNCLRSEQTWENINIHNSYSENITDQEGEINPFLKHCQRHNGPRNWLRNLDWTWQQYGTTYISCKFGHQMAPLALVANMATRWRHLHRLQIWAPDGDTCIICQFGHQLAPLTIIANLATRWHHLH